MVVQGATEVNDNTTGNIVITDDLENKNLIIIFSPVVTNILLPCGHPSALCFELANTDLTKASTLCVFENNYYISFPNEQI